MSWSLYVQAGLSGDLYVGYWGAAVASLPGRKQSVKLGADLSSQDIEEWDGLNI